MDSTPQPTRDDLGVEIELVVSESTEGLQLSEPAWPHYQLESEEGRARVASLAAALGLTLDFNRSTLGLPSGAEWRFVAPRRWALLYAGRVAYER